MNAVSFRWYGVYRILTKLYLEHKAEWSARSELKGGFGRWLPDNTLKNLPKELDPLVQRGKEIDCVFRGFVFGFCAAPGFFDSPPESKTSKDRDRLVALGFQWDFWAGTGAWEGVGYPTPVSDGKYIYSLTAHHLYSCHDLDGNLIWQSRFAPPKFSDLTPEQAKRFGMKWLGVGSGYMPGAFNTSPLLVDDLLISNAASIIRVLDAKTGQTKWWTPSTSGNVNNMANPLVTTLGGEKYLLTVGDRLSGTITPEGDAILRLRDGVEVGYVPGRNSIKCRVSGPALLAPDLVLTHGSTNESFVLTQLIPIGGRITTKEVWNSTVKGDNGKIFRISLWRPAWRDGKLYKGGDVLDAVSKTFPVSGQPGLNCRDGGGATILAGDFCLTIDPDAGKFLWRNILTNQKAGEGSLPVNPPDGLSEQWKKEHEIASSWRWLGAATPFAYKDRLYVRAYDLLWCIGPK